MRAWLKLLSDRHPDITWVPVEQPLPQAEPAASDAPDL
jgi:hypothetical protein